MSIHIIICINNNNMWENNKNTKPLKIDTECLHWKPKTEKNHHNRSIISLDLNWCSEPSELATTHLHTTLQWILIKPHKGLFTCNTMGHYHEPPNTIGKYHGLQESMCLKLCDRPKTPLTHSNVKVNPNTFVIQTD